MGGLDTILKTVHSRSAALRWRTWHTAQDLQRDYFPESAAVTMACASSRIWSKCSEPKKLSA